MTDTSGSSPEPGPDRPRSQDGAGAHQVGADRMALGRGVWLPLAEVVWRFSASGGPGGQHVNTSNTRAEAVFDIEHSPGLPDWARDRLVSALGAVVSVSASDTRSQTRNRDLALSRLAGRLSAALVVPRSRRPTRPTQASQRRRLEEKRRRGRTKSDRRGWRGEPDGDAT